MKHAVGTVGIRALRGLVGRLRLPSARRPGNGHRLGRRVGELNLRKQLTYAVSLGMLLIALGAGFLNAWLANVSSERHLRQQGLQMTHNFARQSSPALLFGAGEDAADAAQAALAFPDVSYVAIYDPQHRLVWQSGALPPAALAAPHVAGLGKSVLEYEDQAVWVFLAPAHTIARLASPFETAGTARRELLGYVRVVMQKTALKIMWREVFLGSLMAAIAMAMCALLLVYILTRYLTQPLNALLLAMRMTEKGGPYLPVAMRGPKDIIDMAHAYNGMMAMLAQHEVELKEARDRALESARVKAEFAASITHDIRTPVSGLIGMLELLDHSGLAKKQREYLMLAQGAGQTLLTLVGDMLDLSRLEAGRLTLEHAAFDVHELIEDLIHTHWAEAQRRGLDIGYSCARDVPRRLHGDPVRLRQVLNNFVGNALKFTPQGQVQVVVLCSERRSEDALLRFEVKDTGIGVEARAQGFIFDPYMQVRSHPTQAGGTGLGLAIAKRLVQLMGGHLGVQSSPGVGSVFWCSVRFALVVSAEPIAARDGVYLQGFRVLVADASALTRQFLLETLEAAGLHCRCLEHTHGLAAELTQAVREGAPYQVVLIDKDTAGPDYNQLIHDLRQTADLGDTRFAVMTAYMRAGEGADGRYAYIGKPLRSAALLRDLTHLVEAPQHGIPTSSLAATPPHDAPARVLVVEDDYTNLMVLCGLLAKLGCQVDRADHAAGAIETLRGARYDLIFMDCTLPDIDGYEATRRIRQLEAGTHHTPIVAVTADATESARRRCMGAGMDDYLAKPPQLADLRRLLRRWVPTVPPVDETVPVNAAVPYGELDQQRLALMQDTMGARYGELIETFLLDVPRYLGKLRRALDDDQYQAAQNLLHNIRGAASNMGAARLARAAGAAECVLAEGGACDYAALEREAGRAIAQLRNTLVPMTATRATSPSTGEPGPLALVVDDDRSIRLALSESLEQAGFRVQQAENGAVALTLAQELRPDVVLLDAVMPEMDGFAACRALKTLPGLADTPVIMITDLESTEAIDLAFAAGAHDYLTKPVHYALLNRRVRNLIGSARRARQTHHLAYHDALTGLPNRAFFQDYLDRELQRAAEEQRAFALLFVDLDRFKYINDTLGHDVGDSLLRAVAERIGGSVRVGDVVARLGGDEFTVVLDAETPKVAATVAEKLCTTLAVPIHLAEHELFISASIGIALYPDHGSDRNSLLKHADTAMYRAKELGGSYRFYESDMETHVSTRMERENSVRRALANNELLLHYQPQQDLATGEIIGMEALIRRMDPDRGIVHAGEFIPLVEETGLIVAIGEWTLYTACRQIATWLTRGQRPIKVAVNLAARQLMQEDLVEQITLALRETGIPARLLELEITEGVLMRDVPHAQAKLQRLRDLGVQIAIDDFGTGYSSLSQLRGLPVDVLKIDRSFIQDIATRSDDAAIVTGILALAHSLRLHVVAEGVETVEQRDCLKALGCDAIQGHYLGVPMSADELEMHLLARRAGMPLRAAG